MNEQIFQQKFAEILNRINELPEDQRGNLTALAEEAQQRRSRVKQSVAELQESLDHLRLSVKYLVFDLEATRRENAYLRKLLKHNKSSDQNESDAE